MVAANKQRILNRTLAHLSKLYDDAVPSELSVLDHLLLGIVQEGEPLSRGLAAYKRLVAGFHNFNEIRVSHPRELAELLEGVPDAEARSRRILEILRFVFETTYAFDLESMRKKPLKQAQKQLSKITGTTPFTVAATVQRALGGHSLPLDAPMCDVLARLGLIGEADELDEARSALEHLVPKAKGVSFCVLIGELAGDVEKQNEVLADLGAESSVHDDEEAPEETAETIGAAPASPRANGRKSGGDVEQSPHG